MTKKGSSSGPLKRGDKMVAKPNPFDLKVNKVKFDVLNRQSSGLSGRPIQSRSRGMDIRKRTIVPELRRIGRTGGIVDRRFGERNAGLSTEDKMQERFSREQVQRGHKKSLFNLNEENDHQMMHPGASLSLTHHGRNINELASSDEEYSLEDEEEEYLTSGGALDSELVARGHFGGPAMEDGKHQVRTKTDIMQEVINKSKMHKQERQRIKEENAELCDDLDAQFTSIASSLFLRQGEMEEEGQGQLDRTIGKEDSYSELIKRMAFDRRARPSNPTKAPEQLVRERQEREAEGQQQQLKRMRPTESDDDDLQMEPESTRDNPNSERSLHHVISKIEGHLEEILSPISTSDQANAAYLELVKVAQTNSVIPLARVIRQHLSELANQIERLNKKDKQPTMPSTRTLLLFHLIGRIFSTSDYHHVVATPAQLLISVYLQHGRILKAQHLLSTLFLLQTSLHYQRDSKRLFPEMFPLMAFLLSSIFDVSLPSSSDRRAYYTLTRPISKTIRSLLDEKLHEDGIKPIPITFEDLQMQEQLNQHALSKERLASFLLKILYDSALLLKEATAFAEIFSPLLLLLKHARQGIKALQEPIALLESLLTTSLATRQPLLMHATKPAMLPQLIPNLNEGPTLQEKKTLHLRKACRREMRGARRELKRDSAFLAQERRQMRMEADRKYKEKMQHIMGSIANEGGAFDSEGKRTLSRRK